MKHLIFILLTVFLYSCGADRCNFIINKQYKLKGVQEEHEFIPKEEEGKFFVTGIFTTESGSIDTSVNACDLYTPVQEPPQGEYDEEGCLIVRTNNPYKAEKGLFIVVDLLEGKLVAGAYLDGPNANEADTISRCTLKP